MKTSSTQPPCPVCRQPLTLRLAHGRKSGKAFVMLLCPTDGRHIRAFISDKTYVEGVLALLESHTPLKTGDDGPNDGMAPSKRSKTNLERGN